MWSGKQNKLEQPVMTVCVAYSVVWQRLYEACSCLHHAESCIAQLRLVIGSVL